MQDAYLCCVKIILIALAIYLAYKFIFKLAIPVYKTSQKIKKGFSEMQSKMQEQMQQQQGYTSSTTKEKENTKVQVSKEDYLDFEEVK